MEFEGKRKEKFETTEKFIEKIKKIQKKMRAVLEKVQEKMKRYSDRKQGEVEEYKIEDLVLLSIKDLKWKIVGKRSEKLTEWFIGPYKVKGIVLINAIELELPSSIKTYPVVNVSQVQLYRPQVKG